jgi:NAD(P)-dependent dehydrogenase (short-subunit alcohol dehydrogenase family)
MMVVMANKWTADQISDLTGKSAIVTGANSGLGFETSIELARHGANVVLACRDEGRGKEALDRIKTRLPEAKVELASLDLADLAAVRKFVDGFTAEHEGPDLLINNAGVMALKERRQTADGFEMQFGTNHLGHFALAGLLLPRLLTRPGARVVNVSSGAHRFGRINFDDLQSERKYRKWRAYGQSKLANLLFTFELDRKLRAAGADVKAVAAHPGYAATNLQSNTAFSWSNFMAQSAAMGALATLEAATDPGVSGGQFYGPSGLMEQRGYPEEVRGNKKSRDTDVARRLWDVSEQLTGVQYEFPGSKGSAR